MISKKCTIWGNLKMHPVKEVLDSYNSLLQGQKFGLIVPYPYLHYAQSLLGPAVTIAAQSLSEHDTGAYSSQVSGEILQDVGINTVMIGHSEVRRLGIDVAAQLKIAQSLGISIIYCIGEDLQSYESGLKNSVLEDQLSLLKNMHQVTIAYEPIWSIGTGKTASLSDINEALSLIRYWLSRYFPGNSDKTQVLYGGSINHNNCLEILTKTDLDGFLVGGVSLKPEKMLEVIRLCN